MYPNIVIGYLNVSSWYALLFLGGLVPAFLAIYLRPSNFPLNKKEIFTVAVLFITFGLAGARILFILLHWKALHFKLSDLYSIDGGFAYFGALVFCMAALLVYSNLKKINFLILLDYLMPFLLFSQVFVRLGCLLAGCCYGKPANGAFGITFKTVDGLMRHPTQAYEAVLLIFIYIITRLIYAKNYRRKGFTSLCGLVSYGLGRFFIEYARTDSPVIFINLTLAQLTCLALALVAGAFISLTKNEI